MFFSLIIPVYNTSPWLNECLDSISSQTFSDWECICVDDGSTDDSLLILQKYQSKDSRFRVFHKTNGGVSSARNYGLEKVTGKYFSFVDSDDIISKYTLENWHFYIEKTNADVLIEALSPFSFVNASDIPSVLPVSKKNMYRLFKDSREALDYFNLLLFERNLCMLAQKVYRTEHLMNRRFDESLAMSEDSLYFYTLFFQRLTWCFPEINSYYYRIRCGSAVNSLTPQKRLNNLYVTVKRLEIIHDIIGDIRACREYWEKSRKTLEYRVRGANDCWNHLSEEERRVFLTSISKAHSILNYYPFDTIMRIRLQILRGKCEWIPRFMEYLIWGTKRYLERIFRNLS